jgi:hypothetical protein
MPRRNHNAHASVTDTDALADQASTLAAELCHPACSACGANSATEGTYCVLCKGRIIVDARQAVTSHA